MSAGVSDPRTSSTKLERKAARGTVWAIAGLASAQLLRLGSNLVLTRLLFPSAFGLMALVQVVIMGIGLFSDIGIGPSIIQNKREDRRFLDTAWSLGLVRGCFLSLAALALGYPMAQFYGEPELAWLIPIAGLVGISSSFQSTAMFTANRNLAIGRLTLIEITGRFAAAVVTIVWAVVSPTVWALAVGSVVGPTVKSILSFVALPDARNRLAWDKEALHVILSFGKWVFVSTVLAFVASQSDRLVFGRLVSLDELGVYSIALLLAATPPQVLRQLIMRVNFPLYSNLQRSGGPMHEVFTRSRKMVLLLAGWASAGLMAGGPTAVELLYEPEYADAGWMVQLLGFGVWFNALSATVESVLLARGESGRVAAANGAKILGMVILMPLGWMTGGFAGAIAGFTLSEFFRWGGALALARRVRLQSAGQATLFSVVLAVSTIVGWASAYWARLQGLPIVLEAFMVAGVVTLAWAPLASDILGKVFARIRRR